MVIPKLWFLSVVVSLLLTLSEVAAHGRLVDPPGRSTLWRYKNSNRLIRESPEYNRIVTNYEDHQLFCGGAQTQVQNGGKCGVCGDNYASSRPRQNEAGGKYGLGIITKRYRPGETITITIDITAQHKGFFEFRLCKWNNPTAYITEECLNRNLLLIHNGSTRYEGITKTGIYKVRVQLPKGLTCSQCVLQWRYHTGNSWGCVNSKCGIGYGPQEEFYGCADIAIGNNVGEVFTSSPYTVQPTITTRSETSTSKTVGYHTTNPNTSRPTYYPTLDPTTGVLVPETTTRRRRKTKKTCKGKVHGRYYQWNCKKFFTCLLGYRKPIITTCPHGTVYDGRICNHPYNVPPPCGTAWDTQSKSLDGIWISK